MPHISKVMIKKAEDLTRFVNTITVHHECKRIIPGAKLLEILNILKYSSKTSVQSLIFTSVQYSQSHYYIQNKYYSVWIDHKI